MKRIFFSFGAIVLFLFCLIIELQCKNPVKVESSGPSYAGLDSSTQYVGMGQCRQCHQSIYETFIKTGMGRSIDVASKAKSAAKFDKHALVYDKFADFYYQPYWKGDSLYILEYRMAGKDTSYQRIEKVNYIIGSGQHTNSHIYDVNGYLYQAPMTYYTQQHTWDLPPGFENGNNSRFNRIIGLECMSCHNGYPQLFSGSENKYGEIPNGIDCERCHGPGSRHVADKRSGKLIDISKEIDYSIVNPAKLPIDLQLDVCQRCHIQGNAVLKEGKSFYDFKPGMKLSDVMNVFMPVYKGDENEHIMASHAERLKQSKCFTRSIEKINAGKVNLSLMPYKNGMTCVTCHDPHVSRLETSRDVFNEKCNGCHSETTHNTCTESRQNLVKNDFNCVNCHMPENKTVDIPHVKVHDHRIMIPVSKLEKEKVKEFIGIAAINNPNPDPLDIAKAYINYYEKFSFDISVLDSALLYIHRNKSNELCKNIKLLVHIYFLKKEYLKVVNYVKQCRTLPENLNRPSYDNEDAWTCYRIGEAYYNTGDVATAITYYKQSCQLAPLDPKFGNEYAEHLALTGNFKEAKVLLESLIRMQPDYAPPYCNLGYIYLSKLNNIDKAHELNERALKLDPDYETALMNKVSMLLMQNRNAEAVKTLRRILQLNPGNDKARFVLKKISST